MPSRCAVTSAILILWMVTFLTAGAGTISVREATIRLPQLLKNLLNAAALLLGHDGRHRGPFCQGRPAPRVSLLAGDGSRCPLFLANSGLLRLQSSRSPSAAEGRGLRWLDAPVLLMQPCSCRTAGRLDTCGICS